MSILSVTIFGAALLGANPPAATLQGTSEEQAQAPIEQTSLGLCTKAEPTCTTTAKVGCQNGQTAGCLSGHGAGCKTGTGRCGRWGCLGCLCPWLCCGDGCNDACDDCHLYWWDRCLLTYCLGPGDFYPHYAYFPAYHGYYYFRPYNFTHVVPDAAFAEQIGDDPRAPYNVAYARTFFPPAPIADSSAYIPPKPYPLLEDVLEPKPVIEVPIP